MRYGKPILQGETLLGRTGAALSSIFLITLALLFLVSIAAAQESTTPVPPAEATESSQTSRPDDPGFFGRLIKFYRDDWNGTLQNGPEPARRLPPPPLDSPPFPNGDWEYGGAPDIGAPDTNVYPLMQAANGASSKVKVYGWVEPGGDISTSRHTIFPLGYNIYSNTVVLDQAVLYIERLADTVQ